MRPYQQSASRHSTKPETAQSAAENLLGDFCALLHQLGVPESLPPALPSAPVADPLSLQNFLEAYLAQILLPLELPAIAEACAHVRLGQTRELIALDHRLAGESRLAPFASASRKTGAIQLQRLKPLRDVRTVQRYLSAVESGRAEGWHTLVYGLTLAVYSFPLRQGLLHYARETLSALARPALQSGNVIDATSRDMLETLLSQLPAAVEQTIPPGDTLKA
jgi:urease accessory protein UreF